MFDIDGTLIRVGVSAIRDAYLHAIREVWAIERLEHQVEMGGRLDRQIFADTARLHGRSYVEEQLAAACRLMAEYCRTARLETVALPGVADLLARLVEQSHPLGLLTGNTQEIGWLKLAAAGLKDPFQFGAFGDEADHRSHLVPLAAERARHVYGTSYPPERIWVIGDTPRDIECAREAGARVVAVATGRWTADQLAEHAPDVLLPDLTDHAAFLEAIRG